MIRVRGNMRTTIGAALLAALSLGACAGQVKEEAHKIKESFTLAKTANEKIKSVRLVSEAVKRLDIQTGKVLEVKTARGMRKTITQDSLIYDKYGDTWTYTSPEALFFVREPIVVERIDEDGIVYLTKGPKAGTAVVIVGSSLLYGMETGVK